MIIYNKFILNRVVILLAIIVDLVNMGYCGKAFSTINGDQVTMGNDLFSYTVNANASAVSLMKNGKNLLKSVRDRTFYFDWNAGGGKFLPSNFSVVTNTSDMVHLKYFQPNGHKRLQMEYHIAVLENVSGFYQWIEAANTGSETVNISEFRMVYRLSKGLMHGISNGVRRGSTPKDLPGSRPIQDTTWQLRDGSYWSKYDYSEYIRETPWFGIFGGGVGAWVVSASREYHSGGPLKQDLLTQHYSIMCHYLTSCHFGGPFFIAEPGFSKFYGPWLLYVNSGTDDKMLEDVARQAEKEKSLWPYKWVEDTDFPVKRGVIRGRVDGEKRAAVVVYDSVTEQFDLQTKGYLYNTETDKNGNFIISNVRPGSYILVLYPVAGHRSESLIMKNITVIAGTQDVGTLHLPVLTNILWNIGETNRRSDSFRYSDEPRNFYWHTLPPPTLTYIVGKSNPAKDWYYAQTHNGTWDIVFDDKPDGKPRTLRMALAAASGSLIFNVQIVKLTVSVNGHLVGNFTYENDKAIYRDALQSGNFFAEKMRVDPSKVLNGRNVVSLTIVDGMVMYDAISYQIGDTTS